MGNPDVYLIPVSIARAGDQQYPDEEILARLHCPMVKIALYSMLWRIRSSMKACFRLSPAKRFLKDGRAN